MSHPLSLFSTRACGAAVAGKKSGVVASFPSLIGPALLNSPLYQSTPPNAARVDCALSGGILVSAKSQADLRKIGGAVAVLLSDASASFTSANFAFDCVVMRLTKSMAVELAPENRARFLASIPLGRLFQATDVANAAVFLAEPSSNFVTGVCLEVDGGRCI